MTRRDTVDEMRLPVPADRLFAKIGKILEEHLEPGWSLGGGTALAARWGMHRFSTDIDVKTAGDGALAALAEGSLGEALREAGGLTVTLPRKDGKRYVWEWPITSRLDLFESEPAIPQMGYEAWRVGDQKIAVQHTAQILAAKIGKRGEMPPVRDLVDVYAASVREPMALSVALAQTVDAAGLARLARDWRHRKVVQAAKLPLQVSGLVADLAPCMANPCEAAIHAVTRCAVEEVTVTKARDGYPVMVATKGGFATSMVAHTAKDALAHAALYGMDTAGAEEELERTRQVRRPTPLAGHGVEAARDWRQRTEMVFRRSQAKGGAER